MLVAGLRSGGRNGQYLPLQTTLAQQGAADQYTHRLQRGRRFVVAAAVVAEYPSLAPAGIVLLCAPVARHGGGMMVSAMVQMSQSDHAKKRGADCASEFGAVELVDEWRDGDWAAIGAESGAVRSGCLTLPSFNRTRRNRGRGWAWQLFLRQFRIWCL